MRRRKEPRRPRSKDWATAPVSEVKSLGDRQIAARLLLLELASVRPLEQVGVRRSGDQSDDVEAEDDAVCVARYEHTRQRLNRRGHSHGHGVKGELTAEVVVRLVLGPVDIRRGKGTQVTDSDLECGCETGQVSFRCDSGEGSKTRLDSDRLTRDGALGLTTRIVGQPRDGRRQTAVAVRENDVVVRSGV